MSPDCPYWFAFLPPRLANRLEKVAGVVQQSVGCRKPSVVPGRGGVCALYRDNIH